MAHVISHIRFFVMITLCLNPLMVVASERKPLPVPKYFGSSKKDTSKGFAGGLMFAGLLQKIGGNIDLSSMSRAMSNVDLTNVKTIVNDNKVMLGAALGATALLLLTKHLKNSEKFGPWCHENYDKINQSVGETANGLSKQLPDEVQTAIWLLKKPFHMLYALIKKYIEMSQATITSTIAAPVAGKLLDCAFVCPVPLCSFTALGWVSGFGILTKGYYDQRFDKIDTKLDKVETKIDESAVKNGKLHVETQKRVDDLSSTTEKSFVGINNQLAETKQLISNSTAEVKEEIKDKIGILSGQIEGIKQQILKSDGNNKEALDKLSAELQEATLQIINLHDEMNQKEIKRDEKTEKLFTKLDKASEQLANAQENLISLINKSMQEVSQEMKKEFEVINRTLLEVSGKQDDQSNVLIKMQNNIGLLLDNKEACDKKFAELLDSIQSSSLALNGVSEKVCNQESVFKNIEIAFESMKDDRESLSGLISKSIEQSSEVSSRLFRLESKVDKNHENLSLKFELFQKESAERERVLLARLTKAEEERKKTEEENGKKLDQVLKIAKRFENPQLAIGQSNELHQRVDKNYKRLHEVCEGNNNYYTLPYNSNSQFKRGPSVGDIQSQMLQLTNNS